MQHVAGLQQVPHACSDVLVIHDQRVARGEHDEEERVEQARGRAGRVRVMLVVRVGG